MINVRNLYKSFGKNEVLKDINETIKKGEVVVIIGPSGSGKSTFLRCLNLLEEPTSGVINFEGEDITDDMRLAFELRFSRKLFENYRQIDTHKMINYTFIDTTFDETEKWLIVNES